MELDLRKDRGLEAAERLAWLLDRRFVDPLLGLLLPGLGDLLGAALGLYVVGKAWRRVPAVVLARMLLNLSVDLLGGMVPVLGDVWDFLFRANARNVALVRQRHVADGGSVRATTGDWLVVAAAGLLLLLALAAPVVLLVVTVRALIG